MTGKSPDIVRVRQRTPEWLDARLEGIGASEAAAAIDVSPWESRISLWARKLGLVPPPEPTLPMLIGTELEPLIARLYTEATGIKIRRANMLRRHPEHTFMLASLDRRAGRKPIELKWSMRGTGYGDAGTDEVPDEVLAQVLHQMAVTDENEADVAAIIGGRKDLQVFTVRRDPEAEVSLIEREAEFWSHVQTRTEPPVDGSEATRRALAAIYPRDDGEAVTAEPVIATAMLGLREARRQIDGLEEERATFEATIMAAMGTATRIMAAGIGEIPWKATRDVESTDWKALRAAHPAIVAEFTSTKPGTRRFGPPKWEEESQP